MHAAVTVHMAAPTDEIWNLIADVRNTGKFSPETFEAEWWRPLTLDAQRAAVCIPLARERTPLHARGHG